MTSRETDAMWRPSGADRAWEQRERAAAAMKADPAWREQVAKCPFKKSVETEWEVGWDQGKESDMTATAVMMRKRVDEQHPYWGKSIRELMYEQQNRAMRDMMETLMTLSTPRLIVDPQKLPEMVEIKPHKVWHVGDASCDINRQPERADIDRRLINGELYKRAPGDSVYQWRWVRVVEPLEAMMHWKDPEGLTERLPEPEKLYPMERGVIERFTFITSPLIEQESTALPAPAGVFAMADMTHKLGGWGV